MIAPGGEEAKRIDDALSGWRQGDLALEERWFSHVGDPSRPLTDASAAAEGGGMQAITTEVEGLAMLTQTCDVVRTCTNRPFVEVAPVVRIAADQLRSVRRGRRPNLGWLPALDQAAMVVDLDRVMTVEKAIVAGWKRTPGYSTDAEGRSFAQALARKRARFAFPNDFTALAVKLQSRLGEKHDRQTPEGTALRALYEIRVVGTPSWNAETVELFIWFIRMDDGQVLDGTAWPALLKKWLELLPPTGRFTKVEGMVVTLGDMTAADYVESDPLDLDHLSQGRDAG